jgi:hypothetical protein
MKKVRLLLCMLSVAAMGLLTACDDDDGGDGSGGGGGGGTNAPASLDGSTMDVTVDDPETEAVEGYSIAFTGTTYVADFGEAGTESGDYTYSANGDAATLVLTPTGGDAINNDLLFDSTSSGSITSTFADGTSESGTFTWTAPATEEPPVE